eukprot:277600-Rhodomonas_salina.1
MQPHPLSSALVSGSLVLCDPSALSLTRVSGLLVRNPSRGRLSLTVPSSLLQGHWCSTPMYCPMPPSHVSGSLVCDPTRAVPIAADVLLAPLCG